MVSAKAADVADGLADDRCRFTGPNTLTVGSGPNIKSILQDRRDRTVILGGHEQNSVKAPHLSAEGRVFRRRILIIILVIDGEIADLNQLGCIAGRKQFYHISCDLLGKRLFAQTPDNNTDSRHAYHPLPR